jgi:hypothetical protein
MDGRSLMFKNIILLVLLIGCTTSKTPLIITEFKPVDQIKDCRPTTIIVDPGMGHPELDIRARLMAEQRCQTKFPNSPCLVIFRVVGKNAYYAICGR